jgi:hypothetical protein
MVEPRVGHTGPCPLASVRSMAIAGASSQRQHVAAVPEASGGMRQQRQAQALAPRSGMRPGEACSCSLPLNWPSSATSTAEGVPVRGI